MKKISATTEDTNLEESQTENPVSVAGPLQKMLRYAGLTLFLQQVMKNKNAVGHHTCGESPEQGQAVGLGRHEGRKPLAEGMGDSVHGFEIIAKAGELKNDFPIEFNLFNNPQSLSKFPPPRVGVQCGSCRRW